MKIFKTKTVFEGKHLRFKKRYFSTKDKRKDIWEFVERKSFGPAVVIFALTQEKEVILEKIYRLPFGEKVLELPAGLHDKKGEKEEEIAKRELLEETGYRAKKVIPIIRGPISPGTTNEEVGCYFAKDVSFVKKPQRDYSSPAISSLTSIGIPEDTEEIEVIKIPIENLVDFIEEESKKMKVDVKILSILPLLKKRKLI
jgi:ADP-ribose pyrophosphatase